MLDSDQNPAERPMWLYKIEMLEKKEKVQFSHTVVSDSLQPHGRQHARPPCPSLTPRLYSNSCPLIESVMPSNHLILCCPLLLHLQPFPASGSFPMSQYFTSVISQSIGVSASASVLPMNIQDWFPLGWTGCVSLQSKGPLRVFSNTTQFKNINSLTLSFLYSPTLTSIHDYWKKTIVLTRQIFVGKVMSLLFNMLSRLVITFLPRSKHLLISWLQSPSAVILELPKIKSAIVFTVSPSICH